MTRQRLIRDLALAAEVSRAEAADAVDELAHRLFLAMKRVEPRAAGTAQDGGERGRNAGSGSRDGVTAATPRGGRR